MDMRAPSTCCVVAVYVYTKQQRAPGAKDKYVSLSVSKVRPWGGYSLEGERNQFIREDVYLIYAQPSRTRCGLVCVLRLLHGLSKFTCYEYFMFVV